MIISDRMSNGSRIEEAVERDGVWFLPDGLDLEDLAVGDTVPDFSLSSTEGGFVLSERVTEGPVLLYFYVVNYGKTCTNYMALMNEIKPELDRLNVSLVHINPDSIANHRAWIRHTGSLYEHLCDMDQEVSKAYGAIVETANTSKILGYTNREFFLVGKGLKLLYVWRAPFPMDTLAMPNLLEALRAGIGSSN